jgi:hypothetical protein
MPYACLFAFACLVASFPVAANTSSASSVDVLSDDVRALLETDRASVQPGARNPDLATQYQRLVSKVNQIGLADLSNNDVADFLEASMTLSFYLNERAYADQMRSAFDELERRGLDKKHHGKDMFDHYVAARMLDEAALFAKQHPHADLPKLPRYKDVSTAGLPTLWRFSGDGMTVTRHSLPPTTSAHVVVVSSPWCHFSLDAAEAIMRDARLSRLMANHSTWIVPQSVVPDFGAIPQWNRAHPSTPMEVVYRRNEWPSISSWGTPGFYFFKDGQLAATVVGWPGDDQKARIEGGFRTIGLR